MTFEFHSSTLWTSRIDGHNAIPLSGQHMKSQLPHALKLQSSFTSITFNSFQLLNNSVVKPASNYCQLSVAWCQQISMSSRLPWKCWLLAVLRAHRKYWVQSDTWHRGGICAAGRSCRAAYRQNLSRVQIALEAGTICLVLNVRKHNISKYDHLITALQSISLRLLLLQQSLALALFLFISFY